MKAGSPITVKELQRVRDKVWRKSWARLGSRARPPFWRVVESRTMPRLWALGMTAEQTMDDISRSIRTHKKKEGAP